MTNKSTQLDDPNAMIFGESNNLDSPHLTESSKEVPMLTMKEAFESVGGWYNGGETGYPSFGSANALWAYTDKMQRNAVQRALDQQTSAHPDDIAVDYAAAAMKAKMAASRAMGRSGWDDPAQCPTERLQAMLAEHLLKGDPVDVAIIAVMLFCRGDRTASEKLVGGYDEALCARTYGKAWPKVKAHLDGLNASSAKLRAAPAALHQQDGAQGIGNLAAAILSIQPEEGQTPGFVVGFGCARAAAANLIAAAQAGAQPVAQDGEPSKDAERAAFEVWAELTDNQKRGADHDVIGWYYFDEVTQDRWDAWQARAALTHRAPPATCVHSFAYFGDQSARRCIHCNAVEDTTASASGQQGAAQDDKKEAQ